MGKTWWAAVAVASVLAGCDGGSDTCIAGSAVECACAGGMKGVQTCQANGTFGTCACVERNAAPTAPVVALTPAMPTDVQDLVCSISTPATDADGDTLMYQFAWTKNGQPFAGATATGALASTVPADATAAGDVFACAASASDGKLTGPSSTTASVSVTASNRAPSAPVVALTPAMPTDAQDLVCTVTTPATDLDGDTLTYQFAWTKNGQPFSSAVATGSLGSTVSAALTSAGDTFSCAASASDGKTTGPASPTVIATVQASTWVSCKALLTSVPGTTNGLYDIDPDGSGPISPVKAFCDMTNGGWTLVANIYDSAGDDAPNATDYVVSGWQQTASGQWANAATKVERNSSGTGSSAVSLAFVAALKSGAGQQNLKMCFVHQDGTDSTCRSSADGSMTLVSYPIGNPKLTLYSGETLPYTFGRLAGLMGSADGYDTTKLVNNAFEIPRSAGNPNEFGDYALNGLNEHPAGGPDWEGVWCGRGGGMSYRPYRTDDSELGNANGPNPATTSFGFRLYVGP